MTAEDRIHLALLLTLCAASAVVLTSPPSTDRAGAARAALGHASTELSRAELDAAIERLRSWLDGVRKEALAGGAAAAALRGLGPAPEDRANPERWLSRWLGPDVARAWLSNSAAVASSETRADLTAALVVLLEAGVSPNQPLTTPAGEQAPGLKLGELVQRVLDLEPARAELDSPWQLDLLSLAVLAGMSQYEDRVARATWRELRRLDQQQRTGYQMAGAGDPSPEQLENLAEHWRAAQGAHPPGALDLHWSSAAFRGAAVLGEAPLTEAASQHQRALLGRYRNDHALYRYLEAIARDEGERARVQVAALESLGRFEEALYGAHLSLQRGTGGSPGPETARVMRMVARELIERWSHLEESRLTARGALGADEHSRLVRAAVHALRGLRTARVAG